MYEDDPMKSLTGRPPTAQQQYRATNAASGGGTFGTGFALYSSRRPGTFSSFGALAPQQSTYSPGNRSQLLANKVNAATDQQLDRQMQPYLNSKTGPGAYRGVRNGSIAVAPGQSYLSSDDAMVDFNKEAAAPFSQGALDAASGSVNRRSPVWQKQYEQTFNQAMEADRQRQIGEANGIVDQNLQASDRLGRTMGGAAYRAAGRTGVIPPRGMGALPSDAGVAARNSQPLGDGGPAAYAARSDQENRRLAAEGAMGGVRSDGLTRYMPNQDLMDFANAGRSADSQLKAMTPSEIQYYRHKMNMANNPNYAASVNQKRSDRQEMLDNRREMVRARRAGALEAAGASQQMRNLVAGRGALAGQNGFAALMSLAAMQNPNQAFSDYGQAYLANAAPGMQTERLQSHESMYDAGLKNQLAMQGNQIGFDRDQLASRERMFGDGLQNQRGMQGDQIQAEERMLRQRVELQRQAALQEQIMNIRNSGVSQIEQEQMIARLMQSMAVAPPQVNGQNGAQLPQQQGPAFSFPDMSGTNYNFPALQNGIMPGQAAPGAAQGNGQASGVPPWLPIPRRAEGDNRPSADIYFDWTRQVQSMPQWNSLPRDQQEQIDLRIRNEALGGLQPSDILQEREDEQGFFNSPDYGTPGGRAASYFIINPILRMLGLNPAALARAREKSRSMQGPVGRVPNSPTPNPMAPLAPPVISPSMQFAPPTIPFSYGY